MPELAEVEYFRKNWEIGKNIPILNVFVNKEKRLFRNVDFIKYNFPNCLKGSKLLKSMRKGKQLCFLFDNDKWLGLHMGMTGTLYNTNANNTSRNNYTFRLNERDLSDKHVHLTIVLKNGFNLNFKDPRMFGNVRFQCSNESPLWWRSLPIEIISSKYTFIYMDKYFAKRLTRNIKSTLLLQDGFPGIGNWMADEILWRSQISPHRKYLDLSKPKKKRLFRNVKEVCIDALNVISEKWEKPPDSWLFNHRWANNGICPKTNKPLKREKLNGRTTCWSPSWQK